MSTSPARFLAGVQRVAMICAIEPSGSLSGPLAREPLCAAAVAALQAGLKPEHRGRVEAMAANDARLIAPGTLVLAIHARIVPGASLDPPYPAELAVLSLRSFRAETANEALFPPAPQLLALPEGAPPALAAPLEALLRGTAAALERSRAFSP